MGRKNLQRDLARRLGVSPSMVSRYKAMGMPTHSVDLARKWRDEHLDPALRKEVRQPTPGRGAAPSESVFMMSMIRRLNDLAVIDPAPWVEELRRAMRALPRSRWSEVELDESVWDALLAPFEHILAETAAVPSPAGRDIALPHDEGQEEDDYTLYMLAAGFFQVVPPAVNGDDD